jgi:hypothetical protein
MKKANLSIQGEATLQNGKALYNRNFAFLLYFLI